jgi:hypothetical protein
MSHHRVHGNPPEPFGPDPPTPVVCLHCQTPLVDFKCPKGHTQPEGYERALQIIQAQKQRIDAWRELERTAESKVPHGDDGPPFIRVEHSPVPMVGMMIKHKEPGWDWSHVAPPDLRLLMGGEFEPGNKQVIRRLAHQCLELIAKVDMFDDEGSWMV